MQVAAGGRLCDTIVGHGFAALPRPTQPGQAPHALAAAQGTSTSAHVLCLLGWCMRCTLTAGDGRTDVGLEWTSLLRWAELHDVVFRRMILLSRHALLVLVDRGGQCSAENTKLRSRHVIVLM